MKKLLFVSLLASSMLNATVIVDEISDSKELIPDMMNGAFTISKKSQSPAKIADSFKQLNDHIKEYNSKAIICKGGNSSISPEYKYDKGVQSQIGYVGTISYSCEFKKIEKFNEILGYKLSSDEAITLSPINWIVSSKKEEETKKELEYNIYKNSISKAKELSQIFNKSCKVDELNFVDQGYVPYGVQRNMLKSMPMAASMDSVSGFEPILSEQSISRKAVLIIKCD